MKKTVSIAGGLVAIPFKGKRAGLSEGIAVLGGRKPVDYRTEAASKKSDTKSDMVTS